MMMTITPCDCRVAFQLSGNTESPQSLAEPIGGDFSFWMHALPSVPNK
jgi:hypothetical protein